MNDKDRIVELHFIDGPLQGTRKTEDASLIQRNLCYRYLQPTKFNPEQIIPNSTGNTWVQVTCVEYNYIPIPLPGTYAGFRRFAMILKYELGG